MRGSAFGLEIVSSLPLPGRWPPSGRGLPSVEVVAAEPEDVEQAWTGFGTVGWSGRSDGREFVAEHGRAGDLRMRLPPAVDMHLSADGGTLLVAAPAAAWTETARVLLDSALFTVSLWHGNDALHAGAVALDGGVVAVMGASGAGKSSLVQALLAEQCEFFTDDVLVLRGMRAPLLACPGPPVMTVPAPPHAGLGTVVAQLDGEAWLALEGAPGPLPLAGVVMLGAEGSRRPSWHEFLLHLLRFPRTRERERARFELAAELAARTPALRLEARSAPPAQLARRVVEWARPLAAATRPGPYARS